MYVLSLSGEKYCASNHAFEDFTPLEYYGQVIEPYPDDDFDEDWEGSSDYAPPPEHMPPPVYYNFHRPTSKRCSSCVGRCGDEFQDRYQVCSMLYSKHVYLDFYHEFETYTYLVFTEHFLFKVENIIMSCFYTSKLANTIFDL